MISLIVVNYIKSILDCTVGLQEIVHNFIYGYNFYHTTLLLSHAYFVHKHVNRFIKQLFLCQRWNRDAREEYIAEEEGPCCF
jgi:hypothetical protein